MNEKNWYKIETNKSEEGTYHYIGSSSLSFEAVAERIENGQLVFNCIN
jgi:hypothetical protein